MGANKQYEVLQWAFSFLHQHHREERVAEWLLQHHLNVPASVFYMNMQEKVPKDMLKKFKADVTAHALTGVPVQHLLGYANFYGRNFHVNQDVLIPRFETEELVQHVIHLVQNQFPDEPVTIVDIGTGSGVIAVSLSLELPHTTVYATDISEKALDIARENAAHLGASVQFLQGDFMKPLYDQDISPHIVVSNPPYINKADYDTLEDTVKEFDPHLALFAEEEGLFAYKKIVEQISARKKQPSHLCFEIGYDQAHAVTAIVKNKFPHSTVETIQDMNGKNRIISCLL